MKDTTASTIGLVHKRDVQRIVAEYRMRMEPFARMRMRVMDLARPRLVIHKDGYAELAYDEWTEQQLAMIDAMDESYNGAFRREHSAIFGFQAPKPAGFIAGISTIERGKPMEAPTIGRRVWYWSDSPEGVQSVSQAFDAGVIMVHGPECVNLLVTRHDGTQFVVMSAQLRNPRTGECTVDDPLGQGDHHGSDAGYATWMPYQKRASNSVGKLDERVTALEKRPPLVGGARPGDIALTKLADNGVPVDSTAPDAAQEADMEARGPEAA